MTGHVLFQMRESLRQSLINGHLFYVEQARKRLLSHFDNIDADARRSADEWLEQNGKHFDPDRHDPSSFYETADDVGIEFSRLLSDMREQTRLGVVAGMFHEWDKQLRNWLVREIQHWHRGKSAISKIWSANFGQIAELLESLDWKVRSTQYFRTLDVCRIVVNVYKHGEGNSFNELRAHFSEYLDVPFNGSGVPHWGIKYCDHTNLKITEAQFQAFSEAILSFWRDVPENILDSQATNVPDWFENAIVKDRADHR